VASDAAREALLGGDGERALGLYRERIRETPDDDRAAAGEVEALLALERFDAALERSTARYAEFASSRHVVAAHGSALLRAGRLVDAEVTLEPLADHPEAPPRGLVALARLRAARGLHLEAAQLAERALETGEDDPVVQFWAAESVADRERSIELLERFVAASPRGSDDRLEAARGTLRLKAALGDRQVWVPLDTPEKVVVPLRLVWDDRGRKLGYVVEALLGPKDKPVKLMLDTGSTGLFLVERMARKRGFEFLSEETAFGGGGDKRHRNRRGIFSSFRLGGLRFGEALAGTTRSELEPYGRYHGLLGIQALAGYRVVLDLKAQQLILSRTASDGVPGEPFWMVSGQMLVQAGANDADGMFLFDTGATWSILSRRFAGALDSARLEPTRGVRGFGGAVDEAAIVHGAAVRFAGRSSGESPLRSFDMSLRGAVGGVEIAGFIGLDLLDDVRITIDTVTQTVSVEPGAP
jgi:tetratricopeptide (TPR) repeat protein